MASPENVDRVTNERAYTPSLVLHVLRNPHGWSVEAITAARLQAADEIEQLRADISQAYYLRDKAEGRFCTALGSIEQLHAAVKTAQELAARRLMEIERLKAELADAKEESAAMRDSLESLR